MNKKNIFIAFIAIASSTIAQEVRNKKDGNYKFTIVKNLESTAVQNQAKSNTCWSFSSLSFMESELLRMGKPSVNLSEMFVVHHAYSDKADKYVRMHGNTTFAAGGGFHDVLYVMKKYGVVPQSVYNGLPYGEKEINQNEMDNILKAMVDNLVIPKKDNLTEGWPKAIDGTLDAYLGKLPDNFDYNGKQYTPQSFAASLGINYDNYIELTSYTHHPFYTKFALEIPDNWMWDQVYNVPLNEFISIIDNSLTNGYTVAWGADVSDPGFAFKDGIAIVPDLDWKDIKREKMDSVINTPGKQKEITQAMRQKAFDNYETTDDHGMHIVGIVNDQNGTKYYIVKNSWGTARNECGGYFYVSEAYVKYKTTSIMINKESLKKEEAKKLGLL
jgi:bleomycin hydrolase